MRKESFQQLLTIPAIILFIGFLMITNCETDRSEKNDPQKMEREEEQEQQIKRERSDTTSRPTPIYEASLEGTNESRDDTKATGNATLTIKGDSIFIKGSFSGLTSDYTRSYIHEVLQSDRVQRLDPSLGNDKRSGEWEAAFEVDKDTRKMLLGDSLYISVHTTKYDNSGELSGQFTARDTLHEDQQ